MASSIETAPDMYFRPACAEDLETIERLEAEEYPADEAASPAQMKRRLKDAGEFFLCCEKATAGLVGYVCGTLAPPGTKTLTEETMSTHDPDGTALCIHSVCVTRDHRRQGVATRMLEAYVRFVQHIAPQVEVRRQALDGWLM